MESVTLAKVKKATAGSSVGRATARLAVVVGSSPTPIFFFSPCSAVWRCACLSCGCLFSGADHACGDASSMTCPVVRHVHSRADRESTVLLVCSCGTSYGTDCTVAGSKYEFDERACTETRVTMVDCHCTAIPRPARPYTPPSIDKKYCCTQQCDSVDTMVPFLILTFMPHRYLCSTHLLVQVLRHEFRRLTASLFLFILVASYPSSYPSTDSLPYHALDFFGLPSPGFIGFPLALISPIACECQGQLA